jgi:hypothetical protein
MKRSIVCISIVGAVMSGALLGGPGPAGASPHARTEAGFVALTSKTTGGPAAPDPADTTAFVASAVRTSSGPASALASTAGSDLITCVGSYAGNTAWDNPHPSKTTAYTTINAHISLTCSAPVDAIELTPHMCDLTADACTLGPYTLNQGGSSAKTYADRGCVKARHAYQAYGKIYIDWPDGYFPTTTTDFKNSSTKYFKKVGGVCVAG